MQAKRHWQVELSLHEVELFGHCSALKEEPTIDHCKSIEQSLSLIRDSCNLSLFNLSEDVLCHSILWRFVSRSNWIQQFHPQLQFILTNLDPHQLRWWIWHSIQIDALSPLLSMVVTLTENKSFNKMSQAVSILIPSCTASFLVVIHLSPTTISLAFFYLFIRQSRHRTSHASFIF